MLTVHHLAASQSERIVWLCEELDIPYRLVRYERTAIGAAPPEYKALHSFGTAPVIEDDGLILAESGAIIEYICRRHAGGRLIPDSAQPAFASFLFWFHFANGSFIPAMMVERLTPKVKGAPSSRLDRAVALIEQRLGEAPWFAGEEFTAADIMMCLTRYGAFHADSEHPHISTYLRRLAQRPACRRALEKAEPGSPIPFG